MNDSTPITAQELEEMKNRLLLYRNEMDKEIPALAPLMNNMAAMLATDLPRCIAEIERLKRLVGETNQPSREYKAPPILPPQAPNRGWGN